jgi:hypothetical protein
VTAATAAARPALTGFRVTHVDASQRRSLGVFVCAQRTAAEALAVAMWGQPVYMAAVRLQAAQAQRVQR